MKKNDGRSNSTSAGWKRPDEVLKIHRIKQKQKALQQRFNKPQDTTTLGTSQEQKPVLRSEKRRNPFSKSDPGQNKRQKSLEFEEITSEDTIFELLSTHNADEVKNLEASERIAVTSQQYQSSENEEDAEEEKRLPVPYLPIDWSIKSRLRLLCKTTIPGNNLKTSQEASGVTSFVRCLDPENSSSGIDISPGARFHQSTLYWQFPHLPWLTMYPRNAKANHGFNIGEQESKALQRDWIDAFRSLFQLVRSRQCPYFYFCANSFTVLFRAAGIGGKVETHAFLTPTTRGIRAALRQDDIEFTMPLKKATDANQSMDSTSRSPNTSSCSNLNETLLEKSACSSDEDEEKWLESLGVEADKIKEINEKHSRKTQNKECEDDFSEQSLVLIEGVECQAFFNFLLNTKSAIAKVGRLANVPPTLLSPVAFQGASLRSLTIRASKVKLDGEDYSSMELKGVILPHVLPYLGHLLTEIKDCFSATMTSIPTTISFTKASVRILEDLEKENQKTSDHVFGRENLSDCGVASYIIEAMCRTNPHAIQSLERISFSKELGGFLC